MKLADPVEINVEAKGLTDLLGLLKLLRSPNVARLVAQVQELIATIKAIVGDLQGAQPSVAIGDVETFATLRSAAAESDVAEILARGDRIKRLWTLIEGLRGRISPEEFARLAELAAAAIAAPNNPAARLALVKAANKALAEAEDPPAPKVAVESMTPGALAS